MSTTSTSPKASPRRPRPLHALAHLEERPCAITRSDPWPDALVPMVGELGLEHAEPEDIERVLLQLEQDGTRPALRMLAHYSLIYAFERGVAFGWTPSNPAVRARPV